MITNVKQQKKSTTAAIIKNDQPLKPTILDNTDYQQINIADIEFSPLNYRKYISEEALSLFADELKQHGIISALLVRPITGNRYELIAGERRLRAARIAGLATVPAAIATLTDEQVIEIQLSENLQRENPHPLHEAQAIGQMQRRGFPIDEIAARLGKSVQFIYARIKLLALTEPFREMLFADIINLKDALQIATLSENSQTEFYEQHCNTWKKEKNFKLYNLDYYLRPYRYDLKQAPFNIKDKKLYPEAGACTNCPSNSASLKTLFPEEAKQTICSNKECYNNKCSLHFLLAFKDAINTHQPAALIVNDQLTEMGQHILSSTPEASNLPLLSYLAVSVLTKPDSPDKEDFTYDDDEGSPELDQEEFNSALEDYYSELEAYNLHIQSGHYKLGILFDRRAFSPVYFSPDKVNHHLVGTHKATAKEVQAAIKAGNATPALLQSEIDRINQREKRALKLDEEKVQLTIHNCFAERTGNAPNDSKLTKADMTGAKLIMYQSLDYHSREKVRQALFMEEDDNYSLTAEKMYNKFVNLPEEQFSYLIRMAMSSKSESKYPTQQAGYFLYQMAKESGIPVDTIAYEQDKKAKERLEKQEKKIKELHKKIEKLTQS